MKKISAILVCLLLVLALTVTAFAAASVKLDITAPVTSAKRGDTVEFTVSASNVENFRSAAISLKFDKNVFKFVSGECKVSGVEVKSVDLLSDGLVNGVCSFASDYAQLPASVSGAIFTFKLKVLDNAALAKTTVSLNTNSEIHVFNASPATLQLGSLEMNIVCEHEYVKGFCKYCGEYGSFPDVQKGAWYYAAVEFAVKKGYFSGNDNGTFAPGKDITRQDFAVVMSRIAKADLSKYNGVTTFADVSSKAYYAKAIHWAAANGVISGYNTTKFGVGDKLTREQLVTILWRYAAKLGANVKVTTGTAMMNSYPDATSVNPNMRTAVAWALQYGVINGMQVSGKTCIAPQVSATRAQVASILFKINANKVIPGI